MTLRQKLWIGAIHAWIHKNEYRLHFNFKTDTDSFYELNKPAIDLLFHEMRTELEVPLTRGMHTVLIFGIESYLKAENMWEPKYHPPDNTSKPPRWGKANKR
jgi:hypothetical protein